MAQVLLKLTSQNGTLFDTLYDKSLNLDVNNTSKNLNQKLEKNEGKSCIIMGKYAECAQFARENNLPLKMINKYNGLQGGITNSDGTLSKPITLTIETTSPICDVILYFDKTAKQRATTINVNVGETTVTYNEINYTAKIHTSLKNCTKMQITMSKWLRSNYHWCISYLQVQTNEVYYDKHSIKKIDSVIQTQPTQDEPFYSGIFSTGEFVINDLNGSAIENAKRSNENQKVKIIVNNKVIACQVVNEWNEPNFTNKTISANLTSVLKQLDAKFDGFLISSNSASAYDYLIRVLEISHIKYDLSRVQTILKSIKINTPLLYKATYKETLNKFCQLAQIQYFIDNNNSKLVFVNARPRLNENDRVINITANAQNNDFKQTIFPKNNYSGVEYQSNTFENTDVSYLSNFDITTQIKSATASEEKELEGESVDTSSGNPYESSSKAYVLKIKLAKYTTATIGSENQVVDFNSITASTNISTQGLPKDNYVNHENNVGNYTSIINVKVPRWSRNRDQIIALCKSIIAVNNGYKINKIENDPSHFTLDYYCIQSIEVCERFRQYVDVGYEEPTETDIITTLFTCSYSALTLTVNSVETQILQNDRLYGTNTNIYKLATNELLQKDNTVIPININKIHTTTNGAHALAEIYSDKPVESNIKVDFYQIGGGVSGTLVIPKGQTRSQQIKVTSYLATVFGDPLPSQDNTYYYSKKNSIDNNTFLCDNILKDYNSKNGIRFASLSVRSGVDFYDVNGDKVIDWNNTNNNLFNCLQVGNIVKILDVNGNSKSKYDNGNDRVWRIIGCEFIHEIIPKWKLELMEVW